MVFGDASVRCQIYSYNRVNRRFSKHKDIEPTILYPKSIISNQTTPPLP
jgi:hypothetical protein